MHWFYKRYISSRLYSRHVLKVDNYLTPESRFNMMIRTLETLIYDYPNSTSNGPPKTDPLRKKRSQKLGGSPRKWGGGGKTPDPPPPPVVALLLNSYKLSLRRGAHITTGKFR